MAIPFAVISQWELQVVNFAAAFAKRKSKKDYFLARKVVPGNCWHLSSFPGPALQLDWRPRSRQLTEMKSPIGKRTSSKLSATFRITKRNKKVQLLAF